MAKRIINRTCAWGISVIATTVLGVVFQTQNVVARLGGVGAEISLSERAAMTVYDVRHLGSTYGIFIALAFIVAWFVAGGVFRLAGFGRKIIYACAGAVAILTMLLLMKQAFFDIHIIAGARDGLGIGLQMLAGAAGGLLFARLTQSYARAPNSAEPTRTDVAPSSVATS